jgi:hypothetical protein
VAGIEVNKEVVETARTSLQGRVGDRLRISAKQVPVEEVLTGSGKVRLLDQRYRPTDDSDPTVD